MSTLFFHINLYLGYIYWSQYQFCLHWEWNEISNSLLTKLSWTAVNFDLENMRIETGHVFKMSKDQNELPKYSEYPQFFFLKIPSLLILFEMVCF